MSERPNLVLALLAAAAALVTTLVLGGLILLGSEGPMEVGATVISVISACVFFLLGLEHVPFSSIVIVLFASASIVGLVRTLRAYRRERRLLWALPLEPVGEGLLAEWAQEAGVRLFLLPSSRPAAFCAGLWRPRIVVSTGLLERLDAEEQEAVVWHEAMHARGREPLKCLLARICVEAFFWAPALRELLERYLLVKELAADRSAMTRTSRRALAGALSEVLAQPTPAGAVGLAEFAAARVDRLFEPGAELPPVFGPARLALTALATGALTLALLFPSTLTARESEEMWGMLSTMTLHGLPGMLVGLAANLTMLVGAAHLARRLAG